MSTNSQQNTNLTSLYPVDDIRPIKSPLPVGSAWWVLILILIVALISLIMAVIIKKRQKHKAAFQNNTKINYVQLAREQLSAAEKLMSDSRLFCFTISTILRQYLENEHQLRAPERTTEEFLIELKESNKLKPRLKAMLSDFLVRCDLVKFAKQEPTLNELKELLNIALTIVEESCAPSKPETEQEQQDNLVPVSK